jgi:hypothetical protein
MPTYGQTPNVFILCIFSYKKFVNKQSEFIGVEQNQMVL